MRYLNGQLGGASHMKRRPLPLGISADFTSSQIGNCGRRSCQICIFLDKIGINPSEKTLPELCLL